MAGVNPLFHVVGVDSGVGKVLLTNNGSVGDSFSPSNPS